MKISIIIPCYNVEKYISECIESVINQRSGMSTIEMIVVDDMSTDGTCKIIASYEEEYPNNIIFIPLEKHVGRPGTIRNIAMKYASGEYIAFLDADDILDEHFVDIMMKTAKEQMYDIVSCGYSMFDSDGLVTKDLLDNIEYDLGNEIDIKKLICNEGTRTPVWARVYRRDFLIMNNILFHEGFHIAEDMFFWHFCIFSAKKGVSIEDSLYKYRVKDDSLFHASSNNYAEDIIECADILSEKFINSVYGDELIEVYAAIIFKKCGFELLNYIEAHNTTDERYIELISSLMAMLNKYWSNLPNNKYLNADEIALAQKFIK